MGNNLLIEEKTLLIEAKTKRDSVSKLSEGEFNTSIDDFVLLNYIRSQDQSRRGNNFQSKILLDLKNYMKKISCKEDAGDAVMYLPYNKKSKYLEVKTTYANEKNDFGVKNIRLYQEKVDYYIIAVVDTFNDFKTHFFCVTTKDLQSKFHLVPMHGSKIANLDNSKVNYAMSTEVKKGLKKLSEINLLDGDSYDDLIEFFDWGIMIEKF